MGPCDTRRPGSRPVRACEPGRFWSTVVYVGGCGTTFGDPALFKTPKGEILPIGRYAFSALHAAMRPKAQHSPMLPQPSYLLD